MIDHDSSPPLQHMRGQRSNIAGMQKEIYTTTSLVRPLFVSPSYQRLEYLYSPPKKASTHASAVTTSPFAVVMGVSSLRNWVTACKHNARGPRSSSDHMHQFSGIFVDNQPSHHPVRLSEGLRPVPPSGTVLGNGRCSEASEPQTSQSDL